MAADREAPGKLTVGFFGAGAHASRVVLPCLRRIPAELVALADRNVDRGLVAARQFGARRFYPNHKALLAKEKVQAIIVSVEPDESGRPACVDIAADALSAGVHVWVDAPPCGSSADIRTYADACLQGKRYVVAGYPRMFSPALLKAAEIIGRPEFGAATSFSYTYPAALPAAQEGAQFPWPLLGVQHPLSALIRLFGEPRGMCALRSRGGTQALIGFQYDRGLVGALHLIGGEAGWLTNERLLVTGASGSLLVEQGRRVVYRRPGAPADDAAETAFDDHMAELHWDAALGEDSQACPPMARGYLGSLLHFAERLLAGEAPRFGNLVDMLHLTTACERLSTAKDGVWITL